jgi:hypothetical protein
MGRLCLYLTGNTHEPPLPVLVIALRFYIYRLFSYLTGNTCEPQLPVTVAALFFTSMEHSTLLSHVKELGQKGGKSEEWTNVIME